MRVLQEYEMDLETGGDSLRGHYVSEMTVYDYNNPVSIQLPAEAGDAHYVRSLESCLPSSP